MPSCAFTLSLVAAKVRGLVFERSVLSPAGTEVFSLLLFWPPARRAADGGLLGAAAPPRPPLHSPRTTPLGFRSSPFPGLAFKGFPYFAILRELRGFCSGSFPSFGRVISLRAAQCHRRVSFEYQLWGAGARRFASRSLSKLILIVQSVQSQRMYLHK